MLGAVLVAVAAFVAQTYTTRMRALSGAAGEAPRRNGARSNAREEAALSLAAAEDDVK